ncbi:MAG: aminopeptidase [Candidatus Aenigmarchaeota archaeon]|nr:aminopeptidase [Candidatus Aenigmarchaeota archaeon]
MAKKSSPYRIILERCLAVRPGEILLIITDSKKRPMANRLLEEASSMVREAGIIEISDRKGDWEEAPDFASSSLKKCNAAVILTSKSLSHTKASKEATEVGVRIVSLPGATEDVLNRSLDVDYASINKLNQKLIELILKSQTVTIQSPRGTNLKFRVDPERQVINDNGLYYKEGDIGTLPPGRILLAPVEGSSEGKVVIDGSILDQTVDSPIKLTVQNGRVTDVAGGKAAKKLQALIPTLGPETIGLCEFGIGTNLKAKISGLTLEDEKSFGNCYVALGNNLGIGGRLFARGRVSGTIKKPTIIFDKKKILHNGKFLLGKI